MSATSQLLQKGWNSRQLQTSQPASCEFNPQLDLLAARAAQLVSAAARNRAVFPPVPASAALGYSRLFSGNFSVGVNLLHLGLSNSRFSINFDQKQRGSCVRERNS